MKTFKCKYHISIFLFFFFLFNICLAQKATINDSYLRSTNNTLEACINLNVIGCKGLSPIVAIYFYDNQLNPLRSSNGQYEASDGQVAAFFKISPSYENTNYENLIMRIPLSELEINSERAENYKYKIRVYITNKFIDDNKHINTFNYSKMHKNCTFCNNTGVCDFCHGTGCNATVLVLGSYLACSWCNGTGKCRCTNSPNDLLFASSNKYSANNQQKRVVNNSNLNNTPIYQPEENYTPKNNYTPTKHICRVCNGTGMTIKEQYVGGEFHYKWCDKCGKKVMPGHHHVFCTTCKGTGFREY